MSVYTVSIPVILYVNLVITPAQEITLPKLTGVGSMTTFILFMDLQFGQVQWELITSVPFSVSYSGLKARK